MKPNKIYVNEDLINFLVLGERIHENDICYISKEELLEWAKEMYEAYRKRHERRNVPYYREIMEAYLGMINKLNEI